MCTPLHPPWLPRYKILLYLRKFLTFSPGNPHFAQATTLLNTYHVRLVLSLLINQVVHYIHLWAWLLSVKKRWDLSAWVFFFFPIIFISWRLIALQHCSGFCHTLIRINHGSTCVPHPEPLCLGFNMINRPQGMRVGQEGAGTRSWEHIRTTWK